MTISKTLFTFKDKMGRGRFSLFSIPIIFINLVFNAIVSQKGFPPEVAIFILAWFMISLYLMAALSIKRFHDLGMSGWYYIGLFIPIISLYFLFILFFKKSKTIETAPETPTNHQKSEVPISGIESSRLDNINPTPSNKIEKSKTELQLRTRNKERVSLVKITPDGRYIVARHWNSSYKASVKIWDINSGERVRVFKNDNETINAMAITPDGKYIVAGSSEDIIEVWDINSGNKMHKFYGHRGLSLMIITPDGKNIVTTGVFGSNIKLLDIKSGKEVRNLEGHTLVVKSLTTTSNGKYLISGSLDKTIRLWEINSGEEIRKYIGHTKGIVSVRVTPDEKYIVSGSEDGTIRLWDINNGGEVRVFDNNESVSSVEITPDNKYIISGDDNGNIKIWDISNGDEVHQLHGHTESVLSLAITPNSQYVISGSMDGIIRLWEINSGAKMIQYVSFDDEEWITFTKEGKYICSTGADEHFGFYSGSKFIDIDNLIYKQKRDNGLLEIKTLGKNKVINEASTTYTFNSDTSDTEPNNIVDMIISEVEQFVPYLSTNNLLKYLKNKNREIITDIELGSIGGGVEIQNAVRWRYDGLEFQFETYTSIFTNGQTKRLRVGYDISKIIQNMSYMFTTFAVEYSISSDGYIVEKSTILGHNAFEKAKTITSILEQKGYTVITI